MLKRQNLKILENHVTVASCNGDVISGKHPNINITIKNESAKCYNCGKIYVTKNVHEKHLNKTRKKKKKNNNV